MIQKFSSVTLFFIGVWCANVQANPPLINGGELNPHLLNRGDINPHLINRDVINPQLINRDVINPQLINRGAINPQLINRGDLNPQLINRGDLNLYLLNRDNFNPQLLNRGYLNPQLNNRDNYYPQSLNRDNIYPLSIYEDNLYRQLINRVNLSPQLNNRKIFQPEFYVPQRSRIQNEWNQANREELAERNGMYNQNENGNDYGGYGQRNRHNHRITLDYLYYALGNKEHRGNHGGRVIIVPKRNNIPITHTSYEMLLEYLRIRNLANANQHLSRNRANIGFGLRDFEVLDKEKLWPYRVYEETLD